MKNGYLSVVNRLKIYRENLNKSQKGMAQLLGVTQSHYSRLEDGKKVISYQSLQCFKDNGGDVQFLITGESVCKGSIDQYMEQCNTREDKEELLKLIMWAGKQGEKIEHIKSGLYNNFFLEKENRNTEGIWKTIRIKEDLTQVEMAYLLDINIKRYRRIEKQQVLPDADVLYSLYVQLGYSPLVVIDSNYFYLNKLNDIWEKFSDNTVNKLDELIQKGIGCIREHEKYINS